MYSFEEVKEFDPEIAAAISDELGRQRDHIAVSYTHLTLPTSDLV